VYRDSEECSGGSARTIKRRALVSNLLGGRMQPYHSNFLHENVSRMVQIDICNASGR